MELLERVPADIDSAPAPRAKLFPTNKLPPVTLTPPLKEFAALKVNAPTPLFTKEPPTPLTTTATFDALPPAMVNALDCRLTPPVPVAFRLPSVSLEPSLRLPVVCKVTAPESTIAAPPLNVTVPSFTVMPPLNVFDPDSTSSPPPDFVTDPVPTIAPFTVNAVTVSAFENDVAPESATDTLLAIVNAPEPDAFWTPRDPRVRVCGPGASSVTAFGEDMFTPNNEMPDVNIGFSTAVSVFKKSAVSPVDGATLPTHDAPRLKFEEPCTQLIPAPITRPLGKAINWTKINATKRPTTPRCIPTKNETVLGRRNRRRLPLASCCHSRTVRSSSTPDKVASGRPIRIHRPSYIMLDSKLFIKESLVVVNMPKRPLFLLSTREPQNHSAVNLQDPIDASPTINPKMLAPG